ncbi:MAG: beta-lactamase family protein [Armatimonadetes bacterium]|nr:beta-lactamase family protein [Armatimonadota bacterium]
MNIALLVLVALNPAPNPAGVYSPAHLRESVEGRWEGFLAPPDREGERFELIVNVVDGNTLRGSLAVALDFSPIVGTYDPNEERIAFTADFDDPDLIKLDLRLDDGKLKGTVRKGDIQIEITAERMSGEPEFYHDSGFTLPVNRPIYVEKSGLSGPTSALLNEIVGDAMDRLYAVGVSTAVIIDGRIADVRHFGWENFDADIAASEKTMYRWASIAKPLTGVVATQLIQEGLLDPDEDVRKYVPEFPQKKYTVSSEQLLTHTGGIVHYSNGEVIETKRKYDVDHPSGDRILSLDKFKESPLIAAPGTRYSYSSHGYVLLGAVLERASGARFEHLAASRVLRPLSMESMQPDYRWIEIEHRAVGYRGSRIGLASHDTHEDVGWKLPAGGWISTAHDLARFAAGLLSDELLNPDAKAKMFARGRLTDGTEIGYGYGIGMFKLAGCEVYAHSGQQKAASTYLLICPEDGNGVVVMSNTKNFESDQLGRLIFSELLATKEALATLVLGCQDSSYTPRPSATRFTNAK